MTRGDLFQKFAKRLGVIDQPRVILKLVHPIDVLNFAVTDHYLKKRLGD